MPTELSVAIIFKNEIRCLERCLKSLQPLKKRISCEIVMADTGSTDGSREIAERCADVVFDFPWVNDFSAARNAVLDRCSGAWVLVMDCDEWLDGDLDELTRFIRDDRSKRYCGAGILVRNYSDKALTRYMDILLQRLLLAEAGPRYAGAIHESTRFRSEREGFAILRRTLLHHDGYVMLNDGSAEGAAKRARNIALLRAELDRSPDDLKLLLQFLESGEEEADYLPALRRAAALVIKKRGEWKRYGAVILRRAVFDAYNGALPELDEWAGEAKTMFPRSYYTRIDVAFILFVRALTASDCAAAIRSGEDILKAQTAFGSDPDACVETSVSFLQRNDAFWAQYVRLHLAEAYLEAKQPAHAAELLEQTDWMLLDERHTRYFLELLARLGAAGVDVSRLLDACRAGLDARRDENAGACRAVLRELTAPPELLQLAERVRAILEKFPADDPAVIELKSSAAYQKVKHLIEG